MGKERDKLIRRYGGVPLSDRQRKDPGFTDAQMAAEAYQSYADKGRLPPEIVALRAARKKGTGSP